MIEAKQRFIKVNSEADDRTLIISTAAKRHSELQIKTLQNAPRDASKLEQIIKAKERENEKARHIEDTQRLVTEIEMLKFVLYLVEQKQEQEHNNITPGLKKKKKMKEEEESQ
jgi:hypothetical protein